MNLTQITFTHRLKITSMCAVDARKVACRKLSCFVAISLLFGLNASISSAAPLPQANLLTYLRADAGVSTSGSEVVAWEDQATVVGGANNANRITVGQAPQLATGMAGLPTLRFDGANDYLDIGANSAFNSQQFTWFMVAQADSVSPSPSRVMLRSNYTTGAGSGTDRLWGTFNSSAGVYTSHSRAVGSGFVGSNNTSNTNPALISADWAGDGSVTQWLNGTSGPAGTGATATPTGHNFTRLGADTGTLGLFFDGDISEVIIYNASILEADRRLIENNLAAKYSGTVGSNVLSLSNDLYAGDNVAKGNYDRDVFGIGREADGTVSSRSDDLGLTLANNTGGGNGLAVGEYALAGHAMTSTNIVTTDLAEEGKRWEQSWYIDSTGNFDGTLTFDFSDAGVTFDSELTELLFRASESDTFTFISSAGILAGDQVSFDLLLSDSLDGYFTLGSSLQVPEPSTLTLLSLALFGLVRRRRRAA